MPEPATPSALSETKRRLLEALEAGKVQSGPLVRTCSDGVPLSPAQESLWRFETTHPGIPAVYNETITVRRPGGIDKDLLERALAEIVRRHEMWWTCYHAVDGVPVLAVQPAPVRCPVREFDLRDVPVCRREGAARALAEEQARPPFDLAQGPLWRASLVHMSVTDHRVLLTAHQSIVDGISVYQILPRELSAIYGALRRGETPQLPELPLQFRDFARHQRSAEQRAVVGRQTAFWRRKLAGSPKPPSWPGTAGFQNQTFRGALRSFNLSAPAASQARSLARRQRTTLFSVLLAAFYRTLHRHTGQTDLVVGTFSNAGRKLPGTQALLGYFLNPVALRVDLSNCPDFLQLLGLVSSTVAEALSHDDIPFDEVVSALTADTDAVSHPLFTTAFSLQPTQPAVEGGWTVTSMDASSGGARLHLYWAVIDCGDGLQLRVQFNPELFPDDTVEQLVRDYERVLTAAEAHSV